MCCTTSPAPNTADVTLSAIAFSYSAGSSPSTAAGPGVPACAHITSMPPSTAAASSTLLRTPSTLERSLTIGMTLPPLAFASPTTAFKAVALTTVAPARSNNSTPARPMPDAAAVITASLSFKRIPPSPLSSQLRTLFHVEELAHRMGRVGQGCVALDGAADGVGNMLEPIEHAKHRSCDHHGQPAIADRQRQGDAGEIGAEVGETLVIAAFGRAPQLGFDRIDADRRGRAPLAEFDPAVQRETFLAAVLREQRAPGRGRMDRQAMPDLRKVTHSRGRFLHVYEDRIDAGWRADRRRLAGLRRQFADQRMDKFGQRLGRGNVLRDRKPARARVIAGTWARLVQIGEDYQRLNEIERAGARPAERIGDCRHRCRLLAAHEELEQVENVGGLPDDHADRPRLARVSSSRNSGAAIAIMRRARSSRSHPRNAATPHSVTTISAASASTLTVATLATMRLCPVRVVAGRAMMARPPSAALAPAMKSGKPPRPPR